MEKDRINWEKDILYGFEEGKNVNLVNAIREGIKLGDKFNPVKIIQIGDNEYCLHPEYGGHHRAVGFYLEGKNLPCKVIRKTNFIDQRLRNSLIRISSIDLFDPIEIPNKKIMAYYDNEFAIRSSKYPRLINKLLKLN